MKFSFLKTSDQKNDVFSRFWRHFGGHDVYRYWTYSSSTFGFLFLYDISLSISRPVAALQPSHTIHTAVLRSTDNNTRLIAVLSLLVSPLRSDQPRLVEVLSPHLIKRNQPNSQPASQPAPMATPYSGTAVIGGGIAGLATAAALYHIAGVSDVHVLERSSADDFESLDAGAAAQLGPNGLRALRAIGGTDCVDRVLNAGTALRGNQVFMPGGNIMLIPELSQEETGLPQVLIRWGVLRQILKDLLSKPRDGIVPPSIQTHANPSIGYRVSSENTFVQLWNAQGVLEREPPMIVAADGIHSSFANMVSATPSGTTCYNLKDNGRVNIKAVTAVSIQFPGYQAGCACTYFAPDGAVACFAGPAGEGFTYWAISIADSKTDNGEPVRFLQPSDELDLELVQRKVLERLKSLQVPECQVAIDLVQITKAERIYVRRSEENKEIVSCLFASNVVLVGDAAHAMSATYGQAANFALEDAATLAYFLQKAETMESAMQQYSSARLNRCDEMKRKSAERVERQMKGEATEDVAKWIMTWNAPSDEGGGTPL
jgi:2-polyprenyl-6-methoxyphenol hydroxylase-like FAD-dependent oxidoreductase